MKCLTQECSHSESSKAFRRVLEVEQDHHKGELQDHRKEEIQDHQKGETQDQILCSALTTITSECVSQLRSCWSPGELGRVRGSILGEMVDYLGRRGGEEGLGECRRRIADSMEQEIETEQRDDILMKEEYKTLNEVGGDQNLEEMRDMKIGTFYFEETGKSKVNQHQIIRIVEMQKNQDDKGAENVDWIWEDNIEVVNADQPRNINYHSSASHIDFQTIWMTMSFVVINMFL